MHAGDTDRPAAFRGGWLQDMREGRIERPERRQGRRWEQVAGTGASAATLPAYATGFQSLPMITSTSVSYS